MMSDGAQRILHDVERTMVNFVLRGRRCFSQWWGLYGIYMYYLHIYICTWQRLINLVTVHLLKTATIPPRVTDVDPMLTHGSPKVDPRVTQE